MITIRTSDRASMQDVRTRASLLALRALRWPGVLCELG